MKWRKQQLQQEQMQPRKEEKKKHTSASSSSFSLSSVLPFSWLAKLTASKPKRNAVPASVAGVGVFTPPPSPRPFDNRKPRSASAHIPFSPAAVDRFPTSVSDEVPRRLSLGDDDGAHRLRIGPARVHQRSARLHSVGDLELTLGHIIPFSRRAAEMWVESDSGSEGPRCDLGLRRQPPRRRLRKRRQSARTTIGDLPDQRVDYDGRDGLPRRSFSGKIRQRTRVKVRSPRPTAARAEVERMRAAAVARRSGLEKFAVVKCSSDPQRDFRDSMVEMIWEKGIGRPEELESLLACYLTLNSDEHHDVIVKVFRQVWFEMNPERLAQQFNRRR